MAAPNIQYKLVNHEGQEMVACKHEGDLQWVIPHDHQEELRTKYEAQEAQNEQ